MEAAVPVCMATLVGASLLFRKGPRRYFAAGSTTPSEATSLAGQSQAGAQRQEGLRARGNGQLWCRAVSHSAFCWTSTAGNWRTQPPLRSPHLKSQITLVINHCHLQFIAPLGTGRQPLASRGALFETSDSWRSAKARADQIVFKGLTDDLWCIHGELYDLRAFMASHPGGAEWLELTRGTDCTEAYAVHHIMRAKSDAFLKKFHVGSATGEPAAQEAHRRATFDENGFYETLRRRVEAKLREHPEARQPAKSFEALCAAVCIAVVVLFVLTAKTGSLFFSFLIGILLHGMIGIGHNFFHQSNKYLWRYCFDCTLFSHHTWRTTHAISHHLYPNTEIDIEVTALEPFMKFLDSQPKNSRFVALVMPFMAFAVAFVDYTRHLGEVLIGRGTLRPENFIPMAQLVILALAQGWRGVACFTLMQSLASFLLVATSFAVHRSEYSWTEGDPGGSLDFGEHILLTTVDHTIDAPLPVALFGFALLNYHVLHHLFPTVDHSRLRLFHDDLLVTCKEFRIEYRQIGFGELVRSYLRKHDINA
eukprot:m.83639 g.83639  ORF g.83639 m.83639 type:complete len:535 (+) comp8308_c0_seq2:138-1742(+)